MKKESKKERKKGRSQSISKTLTCDFYVNFLGLGGYLDSTTFDGKLLASNVTLKFVLYIFKRLSNGS